MSIQKFLKKYGKSNKKISEVITEWKVHDSVEKFLSLSLAPGLVMMDILTGEGLIDYKAGPEIIEAMKLAKGSYQTSEEIKNHLIEKHLAGDQSIEGAVNRLQGHVGELQFKKLSNDNVKLAEFSNQEAVDVMRTTEDGPEFIQVKIYKDPNAIIEKIKEVNEKIENESIVWKTSEGLEDIPITEPPIFAINEDIYEAVKEKASMLGLPNKIENIGVTRDGIREELLGNFDQIESEFFSSLLSPIALSTGIQAFFQWYCHRNIKNVLDTLPRNLLINTSGVAGAAVGRGLSKFILAELEAISCIIPGGAALVGGVAFAQLARGFSTRIAERIDIANRLAQNNMALENRLKKAVGE